jgi:anti-sigma B factor antagonist
VAPGRSSTSDSPIAVEAARGDANITLVTVDKHLRIDLRREPDRVVLELHGELDLVGAPLLQDELDGGEIDAAGLVVLDLEDLDFIDSSGLRVILAAHERARERAQGFALTPGSQQVQRLLAIAGVSRHLQIIASPDELLVPGHGGSQAL